MLNVVVTMWVRNSAGTQFYMVTTAFSNPDPPLLKPRLTSAARSQGVHTHGRHCLSCNGTDHSMETRTQDFLNTSGILNRALGRRNDGGHAYNGNNACAHTVEDGIQINLPGNNSDSAPQPSWDLITLIIALGKLTVKQ